MVYQPFFFYGKQTPRNCRIYTAEVHIIGRNAFTSVINFSIAYAGQERKEMKIYM